MLEHTCKPARGVRAHIRSYADGGTVGADGLTDAQRAKLAGARANLGVSNAPVAAAAPPPAPAPAAPAPTPKPAGSVIQ